MSATVCAKCNQTIETDSRFCSQCGAPQVAAQPNVATPGRKKMWGFAAVGGALVCIGALFFLLHDTDSWDEVSPRSDADRAQLRARYGPEEIRRYADYAVKVAAAVSRLHDMDDQFAQEMEEHSNAPMNDVIMITLEYENLASNEKWKIESLSTPELSNTAAQNDARNAYSEFRRYQQYQKDTVEFSEMHLFNLGTSKEYEKRYMATATQLHDDKVTALKHFSTALMNGYREYGISTDDVDSSTYALKPNAKL